MPFLKKSTAPNALVASAMKVDPNDTVQTNRLTNLVRPWQREAMDFFDLMAEIHYPACYFGNGLSRFRLFIGERPDGNPTGDPSERTGNDRSDLYRAAEDILLSIRGPLGGLPELQRLYGLNVMVPAECYLTGVDRREGRETVTDWELLSIQEVRKRDGATGTDQGSWARYFDGGLGPDPDWKPTSVERFWKKHPFRTFHADGPLQSLNGDCKRLLVLNQSLTTRMLSKLAQAGYLYITTAMTLTGAAEAPTGDGQVVKDEFAVKLFAGLEKGILDGTGKFAPDVIRGPSGEEPKFITIDRTIDRVEMELRAEMRRNISAGLNLPTEAEQGLSQGTHWNTWAISDDTVKNHMEPEVIDFCNGLTETMLWPLLRSWNAANGARYSEADIQRLGVCEDPSGVARRPNMVEDVRQAHAAVAVSDAALRRASNIPEDDQPSEEEFVRQMGVQIKNPYLATIGMKIHDEIDWAAVAKVPSGEGAPGAGGTPPSRRPADPSKPEPKPAKNPKQASDASVLAAAASGHLAAAQKVVGAKVRALCEPRPELKAKVKGVANEKVLATVDWDDLDLAPRDVEAMYATALQDLHRDLCALGVNPALSHLFMVVVSEFATDRQHTPITLADLERLAAEVLSGTDT